MPRPTRAPAQSERAAIVDARALFARIRWRIIPFLFVLYIVSYLDRVNIGFASLHMNRDLNLSASVYGFGAGIFFIGYFLFEVPSNLLLERFGARVWIARIMLTWGAVSMAMAFTRGPLSFYALRFLLGLAEAGFFPGMILYLTYWFPESERARAVAWFMTANALAGVVGGPLSGALLGMHGAGGVAGWQWLFLLEGLPAVVLAFVVLVYLPDGPKTARWLTDAERDWLARRLARDREGDAEERGALAVLASGTVWTFCALYFALVVGLYSISFWLPQLLRSISSGNDLTIGILSAVPYVVAAIGMVWVGRDSDRRGERRWHVAGPALLAAVGLLLSAQTQSVTLALLAISLAAFGIWSALGPFWAMPAALLRGQAAAAGIAWINAVGNLGGFVGPYAVGLIRDRTHGFKAAMGGLALSLVIAALIALRVPSTGPEPAAP